MTEESEDRPGKRVRQKEDEFTPSPALLKKWAEEAAKEEEFQNTSDPMNPRNWGKLIVDNYLDSWYNSNPGLYNLFHRDYKGVGLEMVAALRYERPGIFERIWDNLAEIEIEDYHPPRPRNPRLPQTELPYHYYPWRTR